jgi:hypothetical protein
MISRVVTRAFAGIAFVLTLSGCTLLFPGPEAAVRADMQGRLDEVKGLFVDAARSASTPDALADAVLHEHALGITVIRADEDLDDFEERPITSENITVYALESGPFGVTVEAVVAASRTGGTIEPKFLAGYGCVEIFTAIGLLATAASRSVACPDAVVETSFSGSTLIQVY